MIYGRLAKFNREGIKFSSDILAPFGFGNRSRVYGFFHRPADQKRAANTQVNIHLSNGDFCFTPFPPATWSSLLRISVSLWHHPGSLWLLSDLLARLNVSIMTAHVVRFGHCYALWELAVDIRRLPLGKHAFIENRDFSTAIRTLRSAIENADLNEPREFEDLPPNFLYPKGPLQSEEGIIPINRLPLLESQAEKPIIQGALDNQFLRIEPTNWVSGLRHAGVNVDNTSWSWCIASAYAESGVLRIAPIRKEYSDQMRVIEIPYEENVESPDRNSAGLLAAIALRMWADYNLWMCRSSISNLDGALEVGTIKILAQKRPNSAKSWGDLINELSTLASTLKDRYKNLEHVRIIHEKLEEKTLAKHYEDENEETLPILVV